MFISSKFLTVITALFLTISVISAQDVIGNKDIKKKVVKEDKNSIMVFGGVPAVGGFYGRKINDHFTLRLGAGFSKVDEVIEGFEFDGQSFDSEVKLDYKAAHLHLEYLPFKKSSFKLVGGLSYLSEFTTSVKIEPKDIKYGEIVLETIGSLGLESNWSGLSPYLAFGFGRTVPKHRIGFGFEIGGNFLNNPTYVLDATGVFEPTVDLDKENGGVKKILENIIILPTIQFHLNFKF
jgi:hypothetical protein